MQERCVKGLKVRGQARGTQHGRVSDKWKHAFRYFDTLDLRSPGICRTETEPRGIRKNRHRDGCRILILSALDDDIVLLFRYVTVFRHTAYSIAWYRCSINLARRVRVGENVPV